MYILEITIAIVALVLGIAVAYVLTPPLIRGLLSFFKRASVHEQEAREEVKKIDPKEK